MRRVPAFTLVEFAACLVIAGLLAAAATLSLRGINANARMDDVTGEIEQYLWRAREHAARFGRAQRIVFDLGSSEITTQAGEDAAARDGDVLTPPLQLAAGFGLESLRTEDSTVNDGKLALPLSTRGWTPAFALKIAGPNGQVRWLFVAGLTGQVTVFEDERDVERVFAAMEPKGDDAG